MSQAETQPKETYDGEFLSFDDCESLTAALIPAHLQDKEADLMNQKWFDYRLLHPLKATCLFASIYKQAFRQSIREHYDSASAPFRKGIKGDFLKSPEYLSFWRARQLADDLQIRYDVFLPVAMRYFAGMGWTRPPRPAHLSDAEFQMHAVQFWNDLSLASLQIPMHKSFLAENFKDMPHQTAWETYACVQASLRKHPKYALHTLIKKTQTLRQDRAIELFGTGVVGEALAINFKD